MAIGLGWVSSLRARVLRPATRRCIRLVSTRPRCAGWRADPQARHHLAARSRHRARVRRGLEEIVVVEDKGPFVETGVKDALYDLADVRGCWASMMSAVRSCCPLAGWSRPTPFAARWPAAAGQGAGRVDPGSLAQLTAPASAVPSSRCRACRTSARAARTTARRWCRDGALVGAGIGCHGMVPLIDPRRQGTLVGHHADGRRGRAVDRHRAVRRRRPLHPEPRRRHVRPLRLAGHPRSSRPPGSNITFKILYNGAVAMTGGQDAPGAMPIPELTPWLLTEGVAADHRHHRRPRALQGRATAASPMSRSADRTASSRRRRSCAGSRA